MGYEPNENNILALDDRCEIMLDKRQALSRMMDYKKANPIAEFSYTFDGDKTIMVIGYIGTKPEGFFNSFPDPVTAFEDVNDIRLNALRSALWERLNKDNL